MSLGGEQGGKNMRIRFEENIINMDQVKILTIRYDNFPHMEVKVIMFVDDAQFTLKHMDISEFSDKKKEEKREEFKQLTDAIRKEIWLLLAGNRKTFNLDFFLKETYKTKK